MKAKYHSRIVAVVGCLFLLFITPVRAAETQVLHGHVPMAVARLQPMGLFSSTNHLNLAIGLPLRNQAALNDLLRQIYDPASTNYHRYLTPEQFTERFGPTEPDYQAVIAFAKANGLTMTGTHPNRMLVDVSGSVANIEKVFHVTMRIYPHPKEARTFYAPDVEPSLDLAVPVLHISGLDNYVVPRPMNLKVRPLKATAEAIPNAGSGPAGAYMGNDFRTAYVPEVTLTGIGQSVGLLEFDSGFYQSDITAYEAQTGLPNVPVVPVLLDGYDGGPGMANAEVSLDIEMAIAMAPGITSVVVYEGSVTDDILSRMATDNWVKQIGASWGYPIDSTSEQIFQQFAAQGQSFFNASGDNDAWPGAVYPPSDDPNITIVGGTTLTMSGSGGSWMSETVWNWGNGIGSGGGISTTYSIPSWQQGVSMSGNQGSTTLRNLPDVAMVADNIFVIYENGNSGIFGGTSCSTPLWAAFTALVNQQAANNSESMVGFVNPALYAIGLGVSYTSAFHDITTGNNTSSSSPTKFYAVAGYDLCTGWGTPAGQSLIDALVEPATPTPPSITTQPQSQTNASGTTASFSVTAIGSFPLSYQWKFKGTNIPGATYATLTLTDVQVTNAGNYSVLVTNVYGSAPSSNAVLTVLTLPPTITAQPTNQTVFQGGTANFSVTAAGSLPMSYQWNFNGTNIAGATNTSLILGNVQFTNAGNYAVLVTNAYGSILSSNAVLTVNPPPPCDPLPSGLASWWAAEGNGYDSAGTNTATLQGGVGFGTGEVGQAFVFDGLTSYIQIPASSSLDVGLSDGFTFETWVNPTAPKYLDNIFEWNQGSGSGTGPIGVHMQFGSATSMGLHANIVDTTGGQHSIDTAPNILTYNNFQHVALTYNKLTGVGTLYLNGVAVTNVNVGVFTPQTSFDLYIGLRPAGVVSGNYLLGELDEASLYNRALSSSEIAAIYNAGSSGKCYTPTPPTIVTQPANQTVPAGGTAAFTVVASGTPPLNYQWSFNGTNINGATNTLLTLTNVQSSQAGDYAVLVTNLYGSILSSNAVLTVNPPPSCDPTPYGLVGWWQGETNANDNAGTNNGIAQNMTYTNGEVGKAFVFNGFSSYVKIPASSNLNVGLGNGFTLETWVNPSFLIYGGFLPLPLFEWNTGSGGGDAPVGVQLYISGAGLGDLSANLEDTTTAFHNIASANGIMVTNVFQHVALTYDKTTGVAVLYRNGVVVATANLGVFTPQTSFDLYLGKRQAGSFAPIYFGGILDEASVYNRALASNEIVAIYTAGHSGKCSTPTPPIILTQPTNQTVTAGGTINFTVSAIGTPPLSYQWKFKGTDITGATNTVLILTNVQSSQAGNYAMLVTNLYGSILSSNALLTVTVDHFAWSPIPSPRFAKTPFSVIIRAQNLTNGLFTNFTGIVNLGTTSGIPVTPPISGNFVQGVWIGSVAVSQTASNLVLQADDGFGHFGFANPINVVGLPGLGMTRFGNILLMQWPAVSPSFVLETSGSLSPAAWVPVPYVPIQVGDQYLVPLDMTGTNGFYRLRFSGP